MEHNWQATGHLDPGENGASQFEQLGVLRDVGGKPRIEDRRSQFGPNDANFRKMMGGEVEELKS